MRFADRVYDAMLDGFAGAGKVLTKTQKVGRVSEGIKTDSALATYAAYVLAAAGQPDRGTMNYLKNRGLSGLSDYSHFSTCWGVRAEWRIGNRAVDATGFQCHQA